MFLIVIAGTLVALAAAAVLAQPMVQRARRRRWRSERDERHARIKREWSFWERTFGPKPKRLTFETQEAGDRAD